MEALRARPEQLGDRACGVAGRSIVLHVPLTQARIALLEGERRGVENVKNDLLRRIKMLEFALRQERFKGSTNSATQSAALTPAASATPAPTKMQGEKGQGPFSSAPQHDELPTAHGLGHSDSQRSGKSNISTNVKLPLGVKDAKGRAKSRAYLQQCLQEIAYLTSAHTLNPLSGSAENEDGAEPLPPRPRLALPEGTEGDEDKGAAGSVPHAEPPFVPEPAKPLEERSAAPAGAVATTASVTAPMAAPVLAPAPSEYASAPVPEPPAPALNEPVLRGEVEAVQDAASTAQVPISVPDVQLWKMKSTVQAHFDSVRAVTFDRTSERLFTASDDATIKLWQIRAGADDAGAELLSTLRGHQAGVTCLAMSKERQCLYSGSMDGSVRVWKLPQDAAAGEVVAGGVLAELAQPVWGLALFPYQGQEDALLGVADADGTVKLYVTGQEMPTPPFLSFDYYGTQPDGQAVQERDSNAALPVPTCLTSVPANLRVCAVSYSDGVVKTFSLENGQELKRLVPGTLGEQTASNRHANMVVAHPTLPLVAVALEDSYVHMYDVTTGACTMSLHAHGDSVSCIDIDPSGLTLVSGSHDCTVRFWDIVNTVSQDKPEHSDVWTASQSHTAVCFQEIQLHPMKTNEGVLSVVYHSSAPLVATTGADGTLRLFG